jgi:predicted enzyme related to lactoylglutathione lyase
MNKLFYVLLMASLAMDCSTSINKAKEKNNKMETAKDNQEKDTTPKVTGIGGIFLISDNPKEAKEWYAKNLGFDINAWGSVSFESRNINKPEEVNSLQWTLFKKGTDYMTPSTKEFMVNYRVQNIEGLIEKLKANGVTVLDSIATYDYGKFVHIMDEEGNKIELWEPAE